MSTNSKNNVHGLSPRSLDAIKPEIEDPPASEEYPDHRPNDKKPRKPQQPDPGTLPDRDPWHSPETEPSRHRIQEPDL
ncbi:hypothetical protein Lrub_0849 [Legionella rubrilucens]|uniref:Uncharacterized protein n=1 Tax=Legionella rubrilucens TaxID=458 RepID=A0A0W0XVM2_9GAMM|nr:hypothetical protein [Legionella rubrilucens]KTD48498.1 hypothetical protein Lrub_0849 [Legionella rubrilucens]